VSLTTALLQAVRTVKFPLGDQQQQLKWSVSAPALHSSNLPCLFCA
jgi:hypothetical protein